MGSLTHRWVAGRTWQVSCPRFQAVLSHPAVNLSPEGQLEVERRTWRSTGGLQPHRAVAMSRGAWGGALDSTGSQVPPKSTDHTRRREGSRLCLRAAGEGVETERKMLTWPRLALNLRSPGFSFLSTEITCVRHLG